MVLFLLFAFGVVGMSHIIIEGSIFSKPREFLKDHLPATLYSLFECYQCCGFWCGILGGLICFEPTLGQVFLAGCAGSLLSNLAAQATALMEAVTIWNLSEKP
jgi:hypothetical protein